MAFNIGDTVGDYQIIGILGAGAMGKVYKVRNAISNRVEAIRVLRADLAKESEPAGRFMREIKLLASLNHPNIAALHAAMWLDNRLVISMEFVEGQTLEARVREGPVPAIEGVNVMIGVLSALAYAHQRGVVHCDIKPANIMLTPAGGVKLMDLGVAKAAAGCRLTMTGTTPGSLFYMSPEQVKGSANLDGRSDLYSAGVSLYEAITGVRPFSGDSDYSIMVAHLEQNPKPPAELDPKIPAVLSEVVMTAIAKEPGDRFQSADAFRNALEAVRQSLSAPAPAAPQPRQQAEPGAQPQQAQAAGLTPAGQAQKPGHRGLWMGLGALIVLAALAVAGVQAPRWYKARANSATQAQRPAEPLASPERQIPAARAATSQSQPAQAPAQARAQQPPLQQPQPAGPDPEAAQQLHERLVKLGSRVNAALGRLQNLEQAQKAEGLKLSTDVSAARTRMKTLLDEAESNLKAGNITQAKRNMDQAEAALDQIETFLGR